MPGFTVSRIADALNKCKKSLNGSRILALGVAYKRGVSDTRESAALEVVKLLMEEGANVSYCDPYVSEVNIDGRVIASTTITPELLRSMDCVVVLTDHSVFDYAGIVADSSLILDCRNALTDYAGSNILFL
jgi:UDP-N-acetyl-D-glucosamine dehydrogenase